MLTRWKLAAIELKIGIIVSRAPGDIQRVAIFVFVRRPWPFRGRV